MEDQLKHSITFLVIAIFVFVLGFILQNSITNSKDERGYELVMLENGHNQWSYEIYRDKDLLIRQVYIPAVKGNQYFNSKKDAEKTGRLVIDKLSNNASPSVSLYELFEQGIWFEEANK